MKNKKTVLQKCYEKMMIAKKNPDKLTMMVAMEGGTKPRIVLCHKDKSSEDLTPLAILLTQEEIDKLEPLWEKSFEIEEVINEVMLIDKRKNREDFESIESPVKKIFDDYTNANEDFMDDETWLEYVEDATNQVINLMVER